MINDNTLRIVKISKDALFEYIYETFIAQQESIMDVDSLSVSDSFAINFENGDFIFAVHKSEDINGDLITIPKNISLDNLLKKLPDTTQSVLCNKPYKDFTFDELKEILTEN